ncbi:hypothetical protein NUACC21_72740 [Scytonema sp. NUACC21]
MQLCYQNLAPKIQIETVEATEAVDIWGGERGHQAFGHESEYRRVADTGGAE